MPDENGNKTLNNKGKKKPLFFLFWEDACKHTSAKNDISTPNPPFQLVGKGGWF